MSLSSISSSFLSSLVDSSCKALCCGVVLSLFMFVWHGKTSSFLSSIANSFCGAVFFPLCWMKMARHQTLSFFLVQSYVCNVTWSHCLLAQQELYVLSCSHEQQWRFVISNLYIWRCHQWCANKIIHAVSRIFSVDWYDTINCFLCSCSNSIWHAFI